MKYIVHFSLSDSQYSTFCPSVSIFPRFAYEVFKHFHVCCLGFMFHVTRLVYNMARMQRNWTNNGKKPNTTLTWRTQIL